MAASIDQILREFSELRTTEAQKEAWLRQRLISFTEELAKEIEGRIVEEPTYVGIHFNNALKEAAAIVRAAINPRGIPKR
jgi:hypothetical protein